MLKEHVFLKESKRIQKDPKGISLETQWFSSECFQVASVKAVHEVEPSSVTLTGHTLKAKLRFAQDPQALRNTIIFSTKQVEMDRLKERKSKNINPMNVFNL